MTTKNKCTEEIWKAVKGFEGIYDVSTKGRVRSLPRFRTIGNKKMWWEGCIMKGSKSNNGYIRHSLYGNNKRSYFSAHRLVAQAFIPNPKNKKQVNHINGIKTDNRVENLQWSTSKENVKHAIDAGLWVSQGTRHHNSSISEELVLKIRYDYDNTRLSTKAIAEKHGVSRHVAYNVGERISWKHI